MGLPKLADYYRNFGPPRLTYALTWLQMNLFPSPFYRRQTSIIRQGRLSEVMAGPFSGMKYGPFGSDKGLLPRLLGSYERETYPCIEEIIAAAPDTVAVAGAGEGYFAVGLARRLPKSRIVAFEISKWARYLIASHARRNRVTVETEGFCSAEALSKVLDASSRPAVICDIEGGEREVLEPKSVPALRRASILVELHPMYVEGIEKTIVDRFATTHDIRRMVMGERGMDDVPAPLLDQIPPEDALWAVDEVKLRGTGLWLMLSPKKRHLHA